MRWIESLIAVVILAALLASWTLWTGALLRLWRGKPLIPVEPRRGAPWGVLELLAALLLWLLVPLLALVLAQSATGRSPTFQLEKLPPDGRALMLLVLSLSSLAVLALTLALVKLSARANWTDVGVVPQRAPFDLVLGILAFLMLAPAVYLVMLVLVQWFPSEHMLVKIVKENPEPRFFALSCFSAVVVAPLVEEFLFRVLLQGWLERVAVGRKEPGSAAAVSPGNPPLAPTVSVVAAGPPHGDVNPYAPPPLAASETTTLTPVALPLGLERPVEPPPLWPVFGSSAIFALLHWGHGPDPIPLFVLAVGLGYLYRQTHRVLPGIVVHMLLNAVSMLLLLLSVYG